jgi:hypothetical protein
MENTEESTILTRQWVNQYAALLPHKYKTQDQVNAAAEHLIEVYHSACVKLEHAKRVHGAIMRNEAWFPLESTIRKWIRELNFVELGVDKEIGV